MQDCRMTVTPKIALVALLVALTATGCGDSEAKCWAEREAIFAEMQVWVEMDDATVWYQTGTELEFEGDNPYYRRSREIDRLRESLPDC